MEKKSYLTTEDEIAHQSAIFLFSPFLNKWEAVPIFLAKLTRSVRSDEKGELEFSFR